MSSHQTLYRNTLKPSRAAHFLRPIAVLLKSIKRKHPANAPTKEKRSNKHRRSSSATSADSFSTCQSSIVSDSSIEGEIIFHSENSSDTTIKPCGPCTTTTCNDTINTYTRPCHERFESMLDHPFPLWGEITKLFSSRIPEWNPEQRRRMIHHLIHFLELKVKLEDDYTSGHESVPSMVIDRAWKVLVLDTVLYSRVAAAIQDFHGRPQQMIHYSPRILQDTRAKDESIEHNIMLQRTQALFQTNFREKMPETEEEIFGYFVYPGTKFEIKSIGTMETEEESSCSCYSESSSASWSLADDDEEEELVGLGLI